MEDRTKQATPSQSVEVEQHAEPEAYEIEPDLPWWHPHHLMHHGGELITAVGGVLVAVIGYLAIRKKLRKKR